MKHFFWNIFLLTILFACGKEEAGLSPTGEDQDWFVIQDNPGDPIDHQRYMIFEETGIPVYYNDTIGSMTRYTVSGNIPYTYYEVLNVFYTPGSTTPSWKVANYELVEDKEDLAEVLNLLQFEIFPQIPREVNVPCVLLVDSLTSPSGNLCYKGFKSVVLSEVSGYETMSDVEKKEYKGTFLGTLAVGGLVGVQDDWLEENFYALTYAVNPNNKDLMYSTATLSYAVYKATQGMGLSNEEQKLAVIGFIGTKSEPRPGLEERNWTVPQKNQDVMQYCIAIFSYTEEEFKAQHGDAPVVMAKYYVLREKIKEMGFSFEE